MNGRTNAKNGGGAIRDGCAVLEVRALAYSQITATRSDGLTKKQNKGYVDLSNSDYWFYYIIIQKFELSNLIWTVTATDGTDIASDIITINSNQQYKLNFSKKWIVKNGVIVDSGAITFGNMTVTKKAGGYVLAKNTGNNTGGFKSSQIDFSFYSKIVLEFALINNVYAQSWYGSGVPAVGYGTTFSLSGDDVTGFIGLKYLISSTGTITQTPVYEVDISQIISSYSVACTCGGSSSLPGTLGYLNIKNLYLIWE